MSRWEAWSMHALSALVAVTGGLYFWMKYLLASDDPFAVVNHPLQGPMLKAHVLAAPLLVLVFGIALRSHVLGKLASRGAVARRSGWAAFLGFAAMALSGYLLQVLTDPDGLRVMIAIHVGASAVFAIGYAAHLVAGRRAPAATLANAPAGRAALRP